MNGISNKSVRVENVTTGLQDLADPRIIFLERASTRLRLVKSADLTPLEAIEGLVEPFEEIIGRRLLCECVVDLIKRWEAQDDGSRRRRRPTPRRAAA